MKLEITPQAFREVFHICACASSAGILEIH